MIDKTDTTFKLSTTPGGVALDLIGPGGAATAALDPANRQSLGFEKSDYPQGIGTGLIMVAKNGVVILVASLADGAGKRAEAPVRIDDRNRLGGLLARPSHHFRPHGFGLYQRPPPPAGHGLAGGYFPTSPPAHLATRYVPYPLTSSLPDFLTS